MFKWLANPPLKKLEKQYARKLEEATQAPRNGKMPLYATLMAESEAIIEQIDELRRQSRS